MERYFLAKICGEADHAPSRLASRLQDLNYWKRF
jgi:hypothetical protein